jgi:hypothetical protein
MKVCRLRSSSALDRLQDFAVERVHDVVHDDADDAGARGAQAGGAAVVDIAERAGLFLDLVAGHAPATSGLSRKARDTVAVEMPSVSAMVESLIF